MCAERVEKNVRCIPSHWYISILSLCKYGRIMSGGYRGGDTWPVWHDYIRKVTVSEDSEGGLLTWDKLLCGLKILHSEGDLAALPMWCSISVNCVFVSFK